MSKVKHFQVKPEHVEAIRYGGLNGQEIVDWVNLFAERYNIQVKHENDCIIIKSLSTETEWVAKNGEWVVRSFINSYFYVETNEVMLDQYIKL